MDRYEKCSLVALFIAYKVIILLIIFYEITECQMSLIKQILNIGNHSILLIVLFIYYVHIALYHCPRAKKNVKQGGGEEVNQTGNFHPV